VFFKKKQPETIRVINSSTLIRNIIYDAMAKNPERIAEVLGLPPVSEDVSEMENEASDKRLAKIDILFPLLHHHADIAASVGAAGYAVSNEDEDDLTDEILAAMRNMFKQVAWISAVSCISQFLDMGLIEVRNGKQ